MARRHKLTHLYATTTAFRLLKDEDPLELKIMKLPSLRVIGRLDFRFEGIARQAELVGSRWLDHALFARLSSDE